MSPEQNDTARNVAGRNVAGPNDAGPNDAGPDVAGPNDEAVDPAEETKRKFREALEAKKNGRRGEDHLDGGSQHTHGHGPVDAKRTFRRKTG